MNGVQAEKRLAILYSCAIIFSTISVVSMVIAWQHWAWTLDSCIDVDCECILYGVNTFSTFMGGDVKLCHFGTYGLLPAIVFGLILSVYHGYRSCIDRNPDKPRTISRSIAYCSRNNVDGTVVVLTPKRRSLCKQWMPAAFTAALIACLSLTHTVVMTDGYYKTCEQYRKHLIQLLGSRGREVEVIYHRLSCGAILDFMDYLQPDTNNWRRGDEINTGVALQLAIVASWLNFFTFVLIFSLNFIMARQRQQTFGETIDEIEALAAIYNNDWCIEDIENRCYSIRIPDGENFIILHLKLPMDYPTNSPPLYKISAPHLDFGKKSHLGSLLDEIYLTFVGETVIYQWIERIREELQSQRAEDNNDGLIETTIIPGINAIRPLNQSEECPIIHHGEVILNRKSSFQGHAAAVFSMDQVKQVLKSLLSNRKIEQATHNIYAYRIYHEERKTLIHDCDDDGESQAGGRLLHFLEIVEAKNVLVVVSRWYGGIHLGPDRFRYINNAARQVLQSAEFIPRNRDKKK